MSYEIKTMFYFCKFANNFNQIYIENISANCSEIKCNLTLINIEY